MSYQSSEDTGRITVHVTFSQKFLIQNSRPISRIHGPKPTRPGPILFEKLGPDQDQEKIGNPVPDQTRAKKNWKSRTGPDRDQETFDDLERSRIGRSQDLMVRGSLVHLMNSIYLWRKLRSKFIMKHWSLVVIVAAFQLF